MDWFPKYDFILASKSPRRKKLLHEMGVSFRIHEIEVSETFPSHLNIHEIPVYLAEIKAEPFSGKLKPNDLVITADTIVILDGEVLVKPADKPDAVRILKRLSGKMHTVISGICLKSSEKQVSFSVRTDVFFKELTDDEINFYLEKFHPYDKAGAYGIQEWIGFIGISEIKGSYFNVMGLPVQQLYEAIQKF